MRLYCLISFWLTVASMLIRAVYIANNEYPRQQIFSSAAEDLMWLIFSLCIAGWLGSLLWGGL